MKAPSSISTYLDVTKTLRPEAPERRRESHPSKPPTSDDEARAGEQAARILAAIHDGTELVTELPAATGIELSVVLSLLGSLSTSGLVQVEEQADGVLRAKLSDRARAGLTA